MATPMDISNTSFDNVKSSERHENRLETLKEEARIASRWPICLPISLLFIGITVACFFLGVLDVVLNKEMNRCEMTYMWENMEYIKIPMSPEQASLYPQYNLYAYTEGSSKHMAQARKLKFSGIPVLFIPGNAGSHRQVRSLGSVMLRLTEAKSVKTRFNFFTMDTNDELSGLYGPLLESQIDFAYHSVLRIFSLYKSLDKMIIYGHSMGGIVALGVYSRLNLEHKRKIAYILTQATPLREHVLNLDPYSRRIYHNIHTEIAAYASDPVGPILISVGGGANDILVPSHLTQLPRNWVNGIHVLTTAMPYTWASTDHLCIVWCRQLIVGLSRAILGTIDGTKITEKPEKILSSFNHYLINNYGDMEFDVFNKKRDYNEFFKPQNIKEMSVPSSVSVSSAKDSYFNIQMNTNKDSIVTTFGLSTVHERHNWVFLCNFQNGTCHESEDISELSRPIPPRYSNGKIVVVGGQDKYKNKYNNIIILVDARSTKSRISVEPKLAPAVVRWPFFGEWVRFFQRNPFLIWARHYPKGVVFRDLKLEVLKRDLFAFEVSLVAYECKVNKTAMGAFDGSSIVFHVPGRSEDSTGFLEYSPSRAHGIRMPLRLQLGSLSERQSAFLRLHFHPDCSHNVSVSLSLMTSLGQFIGTRGIRLPAHLTCFLLLFLARFLATQKSTVLLNREGALWLFFGGLGHILVEGGGIEAVVSLVFLLITGWGIVALARLVYMTGFKFLGIIFSIPLTLFRFKGFRLGATVILSIWWGCALVASAIICGYIGIVFSYLFFAVSSILSLKKGGQTEEKEMGLSFNIFFLLLMLVGLNFPAGLAWFRLLVFHIEPIYDSSIYGGLIGLGCVFCRFFNGNHDPIVSRLIYIPGALALVFQNDLWQVQVLILLGLGLFCLSRLVAFLKPEQVSEEKKNE